MRVDRLMSLAPLLILLGLTLAIVGARFDGFGVASATMLIGFGAALGSVRSDQSEQGIWMLAALFAAFSLVAYLSLEGFAMVDALEGRKLAWHTIMDFVFATHLLWMQSRALWQVVRVNRSLVRT